LKGEGTDRGQIGEKSRNVALQIVAVIPQLSQLLALQIAVWFMIVSDGYNLPAFK